MTSFVFKPKRRLNGKIVASRFYSGRYRLPGAAASNTVALKTADKQVARAKLSKLVGDLEKEAAGLIAPKSIREGVEKDLDSFLTVYVAELERRGRNVKYLKGLTSQIQTLFKECAWKTARDIKPDTFRAWCKQQKHSSKTLNEYLTAIQAFLNWCYKSQRLPCNPLEFVGRIDKAADSKYQRRALTDAECAKLIESAGEWSLLYRLAIETGLRRGELEKLQWRDLMLDGPNFFLKARASTTKNGREAVLPLAPGIAEALRNARPVPYDPQSPVFASKLPRMGRVSEDYQKAGISRKDAAGRHADFHSLRHTFCTRLAVSGVPFQTAMVLMRHSDPKLTAKVYTDAGLLPTAGAILGLPVLVPPVKNNTPENTPDLVPAGQMLSSSVLSSLKSEVLEGVESEGFSPPESVFVIPSPEKANGARCRVRTCKQRY